MNYKKHMRVFAIIALSGFVLFWFAPQYAAAIFLPALGAYFGARKASSSGPAQPGYLLWGIFFIFVAIATVIRLIVPEENFGGFEAGLESNILMWLYLVALGLAFALFGFLAYLQRVGRTANS
jgi:hypothetical protein